MESSKSIIVDLGLKKDYMKLIKHVDGPIPQKGLSRLIEEYFKILEVLKKCGYNQLTTKELLNVLKERQYQKSYKFNELKKDMNVWDEIDKEFIKCNPGFNKLNQPCITIDCDDNFNESYILFEEGRFFPPNKSNGGI